MKAAVGISGLTRSISLTVILLLCLAPALYAESAVLLCDHHPKDFFEEVRWAEHSRCYPPNPDCCFTLAQDANYLWVGTSAGAVRWNLQENAYRFFKADDEGSMGYAEKLRLKNNEKGFGLESERPYVDKWLTNAVENIIVLSPGHVWVDMFKGVMIIHGNRKVLYPSVEHALAALYHSDLRPTLGKIVATDKKGCLWLLKKKKETTDDFELFCYDGTAWKKDGLVGIVKPEYGIEDILTDGKGNLWACNARGIYQYGEKRWEQVLENGYYEMRLGASGTLWAFASGTLAKFAGDSWEVFRGEGRYKDFSPPGHSPIGRRAVVLEVPDSKLWFKAFFGGPSIFKFLGFDGKQFSQASFCAVAATSNDAGQTYAASGDRLYYYEEGKWKKLPMPPYQTFKLVSLWGVKGAGIIEDILVAEEGTVYVATNKDGLLRYRNGSWDKMSCEKGKEEVKSIDQDAVDVIAEMAEGIQSLLMGLSAVPTVDTFYSKYVEGDRKDLIKANDEQLAEDIINGENYTSPISYYRLLTRNEKLAKASLQKRMEAMCASDYGEGWLILEIASYGPAVTEILLQIAKTGTPQQRGVAIEALGFMRDSKVVDKLLNILGDAKKLDRLSYLRLARAAIMAGNPRGMQLLIEAATTEGPSQGTCRDELDRITQGYDDLPGDWSKEKWNAWWQKHKSAWRPETAYPTAMPTVMITSTHKMYQAVAEMIEKEK